MKIVILDSDALGFDLKFDAFEQFGQVTCYKYSSPEDVIKRASEATVCISNKIQYTEELISKLPNLKLICLTSTGTNTADLLACRKRNINVCNIVGYSTESVVQLTYSIMFYLLAPLRFYDEYSKNGTYVEDTKFTHYYHTWSELSGKTLGIVGLGTIGKRVAAIGSAFGANIIYYSTSGKNVNKDYRQVSLDELLQLSDIISIHAPLNEQTNNLFGLEEFKKMKNTAMIINLGRGPIVNEEELIMALNNGFIAKAGLDVLATEPMIRNHPINNLKDQDKLFITPHVGWASIEARNRMLDEVVLNIQAYKDGKPRNLVN